MSATAEAMSRLVPGGVRAGELELGDRKLSFFEAGRGPVSVVLEAGRNDSAITWTPVIAHLAPSLRIVAYDRAGLGASDPAPAEPVLERQIGDLCALVRRCCGERSVIAGHSWGGRLAQLFARRHPELVAGLVLVDPGHEGLSELTDGKGRCRHAVLAAPHGVAAALGVSRLVEGHRSRRAVAGFTTDAEVRSVLTAAYRRRAAKGDELRGLAPGALPRSEREGAGPLPDVPMVVLSASRGLPAHTRAAWTALQGRLAAESPQGRHLVVSDCGHAIHHERAAAVADAVLDVVGRTDGLR